MPRVHAATGPSGDQYLVLRLLSELALELLELLRGVAAERLVGLLEGTDLSRNLFLLWMGKPAREGEISQGNCANQLPLCRINMFFW